MQELYSLLIAVAVSLLVSTVILLALARPLRQILGQLCKGGESTAFWVAFTSVMLYAAPLFFAVMWTPIFHSTSIHAVRTALIATLFGAIGGLLIVGYKIANARQI
jgi:hypothetical protein